MTVIPGLHNLPVLVKAKDVDDRDAINLGHTLGLRYCVTASLVQRLIPPVVFKYRFKDISVATCEMNIDTLAQVVW